ncbi:hypothetical protein IFM89_010039 [Coptis chinensis]|uniref:LOB domain-containing protein n=1 Tax=Coptis chinensis TaxID=261450 RepID=A0A835HP90_9MAGN|nr:hypothetical protein IFM89_010039 [Coptis chinensis]
MEENKLVNEVHGVEHHEGAASTKNNFIVIGSTDKAVDGENNVGEANNNAVLEVQVSKDNSSRTVNKVQTGASRGNKNKRASNAPTSTVQGDNRGEGGGGAGIAHKRKRLTCAACRHSRKKCGEGCILAPYFPSNMLEKYIEVHDTFGHQNVLTLLSNLEGEHLRHIAVQSLLWEAKHWQNIPFDTPLATYESIKAENVSLKAENENLRTKISNLQRQPHEQLFPKHLSNGVLEWDNGNTVGRGGAGAGAGGTISSVSHAALPAHMMNGYGNHDPNVYGNRVINNHSVASQYHNYNNREGSSSGGVKSYNGVFYAQNRGTGIGVHKGGLLTNANHVVNSIRYDQNPNAPVMQQQHGNQERYEPNPVVNTSGSLKHNQGRDQLSQFFNDTSQSFNHNQGMDELSHVINTSRSLNDNQGRDEANHAISTPRFFNRDH